jgi:hypothetical protein
MPVFLDSKAAICMARNEKGTERKCHIARRFLYAQHETKAGHASLFHISKQINPADVGTKNLSSTASKRKLSLVGVPIDEQGLIKGGCKRTDSNSDPAHDSTETKTKCSNGDHVPPVLTMTGDHDQPQLARCALARNMYDQPIVPT